MILKENNKGGYINMELLKDTLSKITGPNEDAKQLTRQKWDGLVKPMGSLGTLEEATIKIAGMTGKVINKIDKKAIVWVLIMELLKKE